ncbi:hypothetical protein CR513_54241, partial [Mucuna pruriens]
MIVRSSIEAKYRVVATTTSKVMWLTNVLLEWHVLMHNPPKLLCAISVVTITTLATIKPTL